MSQEITDSAVSNNKRAQGVTLICSYIRRLGPSFGVQNFEFNIFGFFQKNKVFLGKKSLWIFFFLGGGEGGWGSSLNWTIFRGHFYAF